MCSRKCAKFILVTFNIVFFLLGALFLALGIFVLVADDELMAVFAKLPKEGQDALESVNAASMLDMACYVIIAVGGFIFTIGFLGCCGAIKESPCFLMSYAVIVGLILAIQIAAAAVVILFKKKVTTKLQEFMDETLVNNYDGLTLDSSENLVLPADVISLAWDVAQIKFECCGTYNESDYQDATSWNGTYTVSVGGTPVTIQASVPVSCCKVEDPSKFPDDLANLNFIDLNGCLQNPASNNTNTMGCYEAIKKSMLCYIFVGMGVGLGTLLIEILGVVSACWLSRLIKKEGSHTFY